MALALSPSHGLHWQCYFWQDKKIKELYKDIPTIDDIHSLDTNGLKVDAILVDSEKDKKLSMLKQYIVALVKGLNTNPPAMIKKIAGLVSVSFWSS